MVIVYILFIVLLHSGACQLRVARFIILLYSVERASSGYLIIILAPRSVLAPGAHCCYFCAPDDVLVRAPGMVFPPAGCTARDAVVTPVT